MRTLIPVGAAVLVAAVVGSMATFTVSEYEQAVLTQFGRIRGKPITRPGLHFKTPFVHVVHRFDKRWLEWDGEPNEVPTRDKKFIWVDSYARWRISDAVLFYKRLRDESSAQSRLDDIIDGELRNVIASHDLIEVVRTSNRKFQQDSDRREASSEDEEPLPRVRLGRLRLMQQVFARARKVTKGYGIELADIRLKRVGYVASVQSKVFERMISERKRVAERYRSEGQGKSAEIRGRIEKEQRIIESEAFRKAEEIRGDADAKAAALYAEAYERNPELYRLVKSLDAYDKIIDAETDLVLSTDSELFRYLNAEQ